VHSINDKKALANLSYWIDTEQIILDPRLRQPYHLRPKPRAHLMIEVDGVLRDSADFRVLIPPVERSPALATYPPPETSPIFLKSTAEPSPAAVKPESYRERREAKKAETAAREAQKAKREAEALKHLKDEKLKAKGRKRCENVCRDKFDIGPQGFKRIWDALCGKKPAQPKPRKSTSKRRTRKS
jgi:hypothetical protein